MDKSILIHMNASLLPDYLCDCIELYAVSVDNLNLRFLELDQEIAGIITYGPVSLETPISLDSVSPGSSCVPLAVRVGLGGAHITLWRSQ